MMGDACCVMDESGKGAGFCRFSGLVKCPANSESTTEGHQEERETDRAQSGRRTGLYRYISVYGKFFLSELAVWPMEREGTDMVGQGVSRAAPASGLVCPTAVVPTRRATLAVRSRVDYAWRVREMREKSCLEGYARESRIEKAPKTRLASAMLRFCRPDRKIKREVS